MIYASNKFRQKFIKLSTEYKNQIISIIQRYNGLSLDKRPEYLISLCGNNGNAKWSGISKTLYHLYPQMGNNTHRLFYCYATDLEDHIREKTQIIEGLILIDYSTTKNEEYRAAKNYEKGNIKYYQVFEPPTNIVDNPKIQQNVPTFWFCLTSKQDSVLNAKQPLLIKGSAGAGKTLISFELFKQWIAYTDMKKLLYITYTDNLLNLAKRTLEDDGLVFDDNERFKCLKFDQIYELKDLNRIVKENEARKIISNILERIKKSNKLPDKILFTDYFVYSYIRGLIKGRFQVEENFDLDFNKLEQVLNKIMNISDLTLNEKAKVLRCFEEYVRNSLISQDIYHKSIKSKLLSSLHKKDKQKLAKKLDQVFHANFDFNKINESRVMKKEYSYVCYDDIKSELFKDGLNNFEVDTIIYVSEKYNEYLRENHLYDDNDYAKYLLNLEIAEKEKYDAIIVDEVQDLTEIQIEAMVKFTKDTTNNISFFGDPNQTINPTVYDYGRFNSFVYNKTSEINRVYLKETHRCGPNLLDYINHLTRLRSEFKITTEKEDLKPEISAVYKLDTYWACLIEDKALIDYVLEVFVNAVDCYLLVDNNATRDALIAKINNLTESEFEERISNQIITVQEAKGLESKNVILYNLISDNLDIYNNIMNENSKVSSMTFNKLYVSCTRAKDSLLICEESLYKAEKIRRKLFYFNNKSMAENIKEEDVGLYLSISFDPQVFYDQALHAIDEYDYSKALKKNNIALQNIVNQFDFSKVQQGEDHPYSFLETYLRESKKYYVLLQSFNINNEEHLSKYLELFEEMIDDYLLTSPSNQIEEKLLFDRLELFKDSLRLRKLCKERIDFDSEVEEMDEEYKVFYISIFIMLSDYDCTEHAANQIINESTKSKILNIAKYMFNLSTFDELLKDISYLGNISEEVSMKLVEETSLINDYFNQMQYEIFELEGIVNE
jgi:hypothetical protein